MTFKFSLLEIFKLIRNLPCSWAPPSRRGHRWACRTGTCSGACPGTFPSTTSSWISYLHRKRLWLSPPSTSEVPWPFLLICFIYLLDNRNRTQKWDESHVLCVDTPM